MYKKLLEQFKKYEIGFTKSSDSIMFDENFNKIETKQIHNLESTSKDPVTMIAVTRYQYDVNDFSKYVNYIKNDLKISTIYYGLWPGVNKVEYDVLYVIDTIDPDTIQKHLNAHNFLNDGVSQKMALVVSNDGTTKIIEDYERENPIFKEIVKIAITPMISSLSILNYVDMDSEESVLGYGISLILLNVGMYLGVPAVVVIRIRKKF